MECTLTITTRKDWKVALRDAWTFGKRRTDAHDHESEGRSDPLSGSRDLSMNVADRGRVGSMPLYDDYDE